MDVCIGEERRSVADEADLLVLLDEAAESPRLVFLLSANGVLGLGVGHPDRSVVLYNPAGASAPMHALGDPNAGEEVADPPLTFDGRQFFARCAVPNDLACRAATEFLASNGAMPSSLVWEAEERSLISE